MIEWRTNELIRVRPSKMAPRCVANWGASAERDNVLKEVLPLSLHYTTPKGAEFRLLRRTHTINALFREQIPATSSQQSA